MATKKNYTVGDHEYYRISKVIDGQRKFFYGPSKGAAEKKRDDYIREIEAAKYEKEQKKSTATFHELAQEYIDYFLSTSSKYAQGTITLYKSAYNVHIKGSSIDKLQIRNVTPGRVQRFYNSLNVSQQTLQRINKFMGAFCKWLQLTGYSDNFMSAVELPKKQSNVRHEGIQVWEPDEIKAILDYAEASVGHISSRRTIFLPVLLLYTGMRISEAVALKYADIEDDVILVRRQVYKGEIKPPKWNGIREVPMHDEVKRFLEYHKAWQILDEKKHGYLTDHIFTTKTGNLYHPETLRKTFNRMYDKIGIPHKNIHTYRATFATQMCRCDAPMEVTSKILGHKSLEVTAQFYALVKKDTKQEAIQKLSY